MNRIHEKNWNFLMQSFEKGKMAHAYLFCGPEGTGKLNMAVDFIKAVCRLSMAQEEILDGRHPDIFVVRPEVEVKAGKKKVKGIGIEQVKEKIGKIGLYAYQSPYKVLLVDGAERMTISSANSLLKLIEEPPQDTFVVLVSSNEERVLGTIFSRCQKIRFGLKTENEIEKYLAEKYPKDSVKIKEVAQLSRGRIRVAEEYFLNEGEYLAAKDIIDQFRNALRTGLKSGFALAEKLSQDKAVLTIAMDEWVGYLEGFLKRTIGEGGDIKIQKKILGILSQLLITRERIRESNVSERVQLENFFIQIS